MRDETQKTISTLRLQIAVFILVATAFTNVYITQPVLPILQQEFATELLYVSFTVSATILGMALSTLPFGVLVDKYPIRPIILTGGIVIAMCGAIGHYVQDLNILILLRFIQGLFIPALTSSLAAYLAKSLPTERLSVVMGSYVAATVCGGLGGRLLGGWIHNPLHWRYALLSAAILMLSAVIIAIYTMPSVAKKLEDTSKKIKTSTRDILGRWPLWRSFITAFGGFFIFSSMFNYLPFRLSAEPFSLGTDIITSIYLVYIIGIFMGPVSGRLVNKFGGGITLITGCLFMGLAMLLTLLPSLLAICIGLFLLCAGFFTSHAAAVGNLNRRLSSGQGRANALYVLFYYVGGWVGISISGLAYEYGGWNSMIALCMCLLLVPLIIGVNEYREK